jgi:hypothetical protein
MLRAFAAAVLSLGLVATAAPDASAQQSRQISQTTVGPWGVVGWMNASNVPYCTAERKIGDVSVVFARFIEGYALALQSPNWWLTPNSTTPIQVSVSNVSEGTVQANVLSSNLILARLTTDPALMRRFATAPQMVVTASNQTVTIPLDQFGEALNSLDDCLAKAQQPAAPAPTAQPAPAQPAPAQPPANSPAGPGIPTVVPSKIAGLAEMAA